MGAYSRNVSRHDTASVDRLGGELQATQVSPTRPDRSCPVKLCKSDSGSVDAESTLDAVLSMLVPYIKMLVMMPPRAWR